MLWEFQLGEFSDEGHDVGKTLEEWIECIANYFDLNQSSEKNEATMAHFKLEKIAKLWWKEHYMEEKHTHPCTTTWDYIKNQLKKIYQNKTYVVKQVLILHLGNQRLGRVLS